MVSSEKREYAEVYASSRITENNITNTNFSKDDLLEKILDKDNLNKAFKKVKSNKGARWNRWDGSRASSTISQRK